MNKWIAVPISHDNSRQFSATGMLADFWMSNLHGVCG